jgi:hypothetical protein
MSAPEGRSNKAAAIETTKAESLFAEFRYMPFLRSVKKRIWKFEWN